MSTVTLYYCDRCGSEIRSMKDKKAVEVTYWGLQGIRSHEMTDLCPKCYKELEDFLEELK